MRVVDLKAKTEDGVAIAKLGVACSVDCVDWTMPESRLLVGLRDVARAVVLLADVGGKIRVVAASVCEEEAVTARMSIEDGDTMTTLPWLDEGCGKDVRGAGVLLGGEEVEVPAAESGAPAEDGGITVDVLDAGVCP